ncbi:MAG TPA: DUF2802 domain-containing protein [Gammaproteobacteria bacterium]|nr:DUF2802 domain-containing protein [Gammaproteobacteria bacterium]
MILPILILASLSAAALLGVALQWRSLRRLRADNARLAERLLATEQQIRHLGNEFGALCKASAGAGDHVLRLEQQVKRLTERQNMLELRASADRPYSEASRLAHDGAGIHELVTNCGLTRGEAELMVMLHGRSDPDAA